MVVLGHQQRPADIPALARRRTPPSSASSHASIRARSTCHALGPAAVRAQDPEAPSAAMRSAGRLPARRPRSPPRRPPRAPGRRHRPSASPRHRVGPSSDPGDASVAEHRAARVGVAAADRVGERAIAPRTVDPVEHDDPVADRRPWRLGAAHRDAGPAELAAPAAHRQPSAAGRRCRPAPRPPRSTRAARGRRPAPAARRGAAPRPAWPSATATPSRSRRRSRRRGQALRGRGESGCGCPGRQPSSRCSVDGLQGEQLRRGPRRSHRACAPPRAPPPASRAARLARRRRERDQRRAAGAAPARPAARRSERRSSSCRFPGRRRRPRTGAGPRPPPHAPGAPIVLAPEQRASPSAQHVLVDSARVGARRHRPKAGRRRSTLLAPSSGPDTATPPTSRSGRVGPPAPRRGDERAAPPPHRSTAPASGHGSADRSTGSSASTAAVSRIAARSTWTCTEPGRTHRQRDREQHRSSGSPAKPAEPRRDLDVGRRRARRRVEFAQQARAPRDAPHVVGVVLLGDRAHPAAPVERRHSARSTSPRRPPARTRPQARPSSHRVPGPVIPRTNRYSTPARCASGS